jgi:hypothetical protein
MRMMHEHGFPADRPTMETTPAPAATRTGHPCAYLWRYESRWHPPLPLRRFALRLLAHAGFAAGLAGASMAVGIVGFMHYERLAWRDAFLQTAMLLGGMGPTEVPRTPGGKLFAALFALYAGVVFIVTAAILVTPAVHRVLHRFHWERGP